MSKAEVVKKAVEADRGIGAEESRRRAANERIMSESRDQYRSFIETINKSSDRDIERAMTRA